METYLQQLEAQAHTRCALLWIHTLVSLARQENACFSIFIMLQGMASAVIHGHWGNADWAISVTSSSAPPFAGVILSGIATAPEILSQLTGATTRMQGKKDYETRQRGARPMHRSGAESLLGLWEKRKRGANGELRGAFFQTGCPLGT